MQHNYKLTTPKHCSQFLLNPLIQTYSCPHACHKGTRGTEGIVPPILTFGTRPCSINYKIKLGYTLLNVDILLLDLFSLQKHFKSSLALVLDALVVPRTETLAVDWLQLT